MTIGKEKRGWECFGGVKRSVTFAVALHFTIGA